MARSFVSGSWEWPEKATAWGERGKKLCRSAVIDAPGVPTVHGVSGMRMLDVEERLRKIALLHRRTKRVRATGTASLRISVAPDAGLPVRTEEIEPLHRFHEIRLPFLVKTEVPRLARIGLDRLAAEFRRIFEYIYAFFKRICVVVAEHEKTLDLSPVGGSVVREYFKPGVRDGFQFTHKTDVGDIAGDHDRINSAIAEISERPLQRLSAVAFREGTPVSGKLHMNVAHHSELQQRSAAADENRRSPASGRKSRAGEHPGDKITPLYHICTSQMRPAALPGLLFSFESHFAVQYTIT